LALDFQREFSAYMRKLNEFSPKFPGEFSMLCHVLADECGQIRSPQDVSRGAPNSSRMAKMLLKRLESGTPTKWSPGSESRVVSAKDFADLLVKFGQALDTGAPAASGAGDHPLAILTLYRAAGDFGAKMESPNPLPFDAKRYEDELASVLGEDASDAVPRVQAAKRSGSTASEPEIKTGPLRALSKNPPRPEPVIERVPDPPPRPLPKPRVIPQTAPAASSAPRAIQRVARSAEGGDNGPGDIPKSLGRPLRSIPAAPPDSGAEFATRQAPAPLSKPAPNPEARSSGSAGGLRSGGGASLKPSTADEDPFFAALHFLGPEDPAARVPDNARPAGYRGLRRTSRTAPAPAPLARRFQPQKKTVAEVLKNTVPGIRRDLSGLALGRYTLGAMIGEGPSGQVYGAMHPQLHRRVAIKVLEKTRDADPKRVQAFLRQGKRLARIEHRHLTRVLEVGKDDNIVFVVMERFDGADMKQSLGEGGYIHEGRALDIVLGVADALRYANDGFQIAHGDIKPSNIVIDRSGQTKIVDLGLAKIVRPDPSKLELAEATPLYIAPEVSDNPGSADFRSDMYSLGATLFHMVAGRPPFDEPTVEELFAAHVNELPPDPRTRGAEVSNATAWLILRLMSKNPEDRFESYDELIKALYAVMAGKTPAQKKRGLIRSLLGLLWPFGR
jgi:hypothetical protein